MSSDFYKNMALVCNTPSCGFNSAANLENLSVTQAKLLNSWLNPTFIPTAEELKDLSNLIKNEVECPKHGREKLSFAKVTMVPVEVRLEHDEAVVYLIDSHFE